MSCRAGPAVRSHNPHPPAVPSRRIHEAETHQKRSLTTFCGGLVDKHEDEIVAALKNDDFGTEEGARFVCV